METIFDWLTVLVFCGLAVIYLQRSALAEPQDKVWHYIPPAVGCAAANWLGNEGYQTVAVLLIVAVMAYVYYVLKPRLAG